MTAKPTNETTPKTAQTRLKLLFHKQSKQINAERESSIVLKMIEKSNPENFIKNAQVSAEINASVYPIGISFFITSLIDCFFLLRKPSSIKHVHQRLHPSQNLRLFPLHLSRTQ